MSRPLEGIKVLDFSRYLPGPYCSLLLSDMGAEVIKVEEPGQGDLARYMPPMLEGQGAAFIGLNRGKKSITLDLRAQVARDALYRMVPSFDVVLESFRPGVMERLGLGYETLKALNPGLIYCAISGYGQVGPMRDKAGHDLNYVALAGILGATGPEEGPPEMPAVQIADVAGGSYPAAVAIIAALFERTRTQKGQFLDISLTDGALSMMLFHLAGHLVDGKGVPPGRLPLNGGLINYRTYRTKDGKAMALGALEPKFFIAFLKRAGRPELISLMQAQGEELIQARAALGALFAERTRDEWVALLAEVDVCCEPVLEADEVVFHPLHRSRGMVREVVTGHDAQGKVQTIETVMGPLPFGREGLLAGGGVDEQPLPQAPSLGANGREVLLAHGFSEDEIETLRRSGGL